MVKVKICGITNQEDALEAVTCGADFLGFIFVKNTPRFVNKNIVKAILSSGFKKINPNLICVGLFKDEGLEEVADIINYCGLNCVQLHGAETPDYCARLKKVLCKEYGTLVTVIKSFKVGQEILPNGNYGIRDYESADYFVFDTFHPEIAGGTGTEFDTEVLKKEKVRIKTPFFIAGGLNPGNVSYVVKNILPYGVDVSSGVETIVGKKDKNLLKEFIYNAKNA
ncbi:MAG: phosphoribosylanthranilate isomerase [Candidatus Omnitrophota bacterium]